MADRLTPPPPGEDSVSSWNITLVPTWDEAVHAARMLVILVVGILVILIIYALPRRHS